MTGTAPTRLALALVLLAGAVLGTIALRAKERSYVVPRAEEASPIPIALPIELTSDVPPGLALRVFDVEGICCQGCSGKLHGALLAVEGVRAAAVDPTTKQVSALVQSEVDPGELERALTFDKYTAKAR